MFTLDILDNIKLTLEVTESYLKNIIDEPDNVKNYKMAILNLHNALELTFKFLLQSRNHFMIYSMQDSTSYRKVMEYYKSRYNYKRSNDNRLPENKLHTVSFTTSYELLAYFYNESKFDEKFLFKLERLNRLRNGLTHFTATIEYTDIVILYNLFKECVDLFNIELKSKRRFVRDLVNNRTKVSYELDMTLYHRYGNAIEKIRMNLLDIDIIKEFVSYLIKNIGNIEDIRLDDYEKLLAYFFKEQISTTNFNEELVSSLGFTESHIKAMKEQHKKEISNEKNRKEKIIAIYKKEKTCISIKDFLLNAIFIMLESDFIYNRTYYDSFGIDILGGLSITVSCKNLILKKWNHKLDLICSELGINQQEYNNLLEFEGDYEEEKYIDELYEVDANIDRDFNDMSTGNPF